MSCKRKFGRLVLISYSDVTNVLVFKPDCDRSGHEVRLVPKVDFFWLCNMGAINGSTQAKPAGESIS